MSISPKILAKIGHYYFRERLTMAQIGKRLSMSRHRVGRLVREAEDRGIVRIEIVTPFTSETALERELEETLGLKTAVVVDVGDLVDEAEIKTRTCAAGAELVNEFIQPGSTIGVGWGSTTFDLVNEISAATVPDVKVVQITGGNKLLSANFDCHEITRRLAERLNVGPVLLHAPGIVDLPETRDLLLEDSSVRQTFELFDELSIAIVGIGSLVPDFSSMLLSSGYIPKDDVDHLLEGGAIGDVFSYFIDSDGNIVRTALYDRLITIGFEQIKRVPTLVGVAVGVVKAKAVLAAALGGFVNTLVVDSVLAKEILQEAKARGISRKPGVEVRARSLERPDPTRLENQRSTASAEDHLSPKIKTGRTSA